MLTILNHWHELKIRVGYIILSFSVTLVVAYFYSEILVYVCVVPFIDKFEQKKFIFTNLSEAFYSCLFLSLNLSIITSVIYTLYMIFSFLKAGLYKKEFYILKTIVIFITMSLVSSILFVYFFILPRIFSFFVNFESSKLFELTLEARIFEYLDLVQNCLFWVSFVFQIPVLLFLLIYLNILDIELLLNRRKESTIICFIIGALLSPPDIFTQVLIALPLCVLLEVMILLFILIDEYNLGLSRGELLEW
jgi:sec-independent protein translocase protein TatC